MIGLLGINHKTAPISAREVFAFDNPSSTDWVAELIQDQLIRGGVLLSTCNRMELYFESSATCSAGLRKRLIESLTKCKQTRHIDNSWFIYKEGGETMEHLFRLSAGLESIVLGETQILGQLKEAFRHSCEHEQTTSILSRLFHKAFETAKAIRSEYLISATPISAGAASVRLLQEQLPSLLTRPILLIGAGQIAETIYDELQQLGASNLSLYNRTHSRGMRFIERHPHIQKLFTDDELSKAIQSHEVLFVATSSLHPIITQELMPKERIYWIFDLAVPRNVSPDVEGCSGVHLYTIDDLHSQEGIELSLERTEKINQKLQEAVADFTRWCEASKIREVIGTIQQTADTLLERELRNLPRHLTESQRELISQYNKHLRITMATAIVASLREITHDGDHTSYTEAIHRLFSHILEKEQYENH